MTDFMQFKSGTDIRGIAANGVAGEEITLTDNVICRITDAFAFWLCQKLGKNPSDVKISVGNDSRISADRIRGCVTETLSKRGFRVLVCGLSSTPAMFMTTVDIDCDAAVQITASHHPFNRNGLKFFTKNGGLEGKEIAEILEIANSDKMLSFAVGSIEEIDYMTAYAERLRKMIIDEVNCEEDRLHPLKGKKIVVDAGNGAGGFYAYNVLKPLGADITGSQFLEPDGMFPNHIPNPENEQAMNSARNAVVNSGADLGIVFDTDVDRAAIVDNGGNEINRNRLIALAASIALYDNKGATIVTDSVTSDGLTHFIENVLGGRHYRYKRGYRNVIDEALRLNGEGINCPLAIETSGHAALRENYFLDDGAYLVTRVVILMAKLARKGKNIGALLLDLPEPQESVEYRINLPVSNFLEIGDNVLKEFYAYAQGKDGWSIAKDNREGVRVSTDENNGDGWMLLRMSVHDPVMPLNIESNRPGGADIMMDEFRRFLAKHTELSV